MPFKSKAQRRWMYAAEARGEVEPGTADRWQKETKGKKLPERVKKEADIIKHSAVQKMKMGINKRQTAMINRMIAYNASSPEKRRAFMMSYKKMNGRVVKRKVDPLALKDTKKGQVILGWDHRRKAYRTFKPERVVEMKKVAFWQGFVKKATTINQRIGNPFSNPTPKPPPPPPPPPADVSPQGSGSLAQQIGSGFASLMGKR